MAFVDQAIGDLYASARYSSLPLRIAGALVRNIRHLRVQLGDPLVTFDWCGETMYLPLSHELPRFTTTCPHYNMNLGRLAAVMHRQLGRPIMAIDIGANVGDTAILLLKNGADKVICIEGSRRYAELLRRNTRHLPQVVSSECLVAFSGASKNLRIAEAMGTGVVVQCSDSGSVPVMTLEEVLASHHRDQQEVDLVKIDTDGYDGAIIRYHADFFASVRPVVHFEYLFCGADAASSTCPLPDEQALESLATAGYERLIAYRNTGEPALYRPLAGAGKILRELYTSDRLGIYADLAVFPPSAGHIADEAAREIGLEFSTP